MATVEAGPRPLTARQRDILEFIYQCVRERGYQPTMREVAARFGMRTLGSTGPMSAYEALARKGYVARPMKGWAGVRLLRLTDGSPFRGFVEVRDPP
jgi:SOS-response transcriptional repressor LexA